MTATMRPLGPNVARSPAGLGTDPNQWKMVTIRRTQVRITKFSQWLKRVRVLPAEKSLAASAPAPPRHPARAAVQPAQSPPPSPRSEARRLCGNRSKQRWMNGYMNLRCKQRQILRWSR